MWRLTYGRMVTQGVAAVTAPADDPAIDYIAHNKQLARLLVMRTDGTFKRYRPTDADYARLLALARSWGDGELAHRFDDTIKYRRVSHGKVA